MSRPSSSSLSSSLSSSQTKYKAVVFFTNGQNDNCSLITKELTKKNINLEEENILFLVENGNRTAKELILANSGKIEGHIDNQTIAIVKSHGSGSGNIGGTDFETLDNLLKELGFNNELIFGCYTGTGLKEKAKNKKSADKKSEDKNQRLTVIGAGKKHQTYSGITNQSIIAILESISNNKKLEDDEKLSARDLLIESARKYPGTIYYEDQEEIGKYGMAGKFTIDEIEKIIGEDEISKDLITKLKSDKKKSESVDSKNFSIAKIIEALSSDKKYSAIIKKFENALAEKLRPENIASKLNERFAEGKSSKTETLSKAELDQIEKDFFIEAAHRNNELYVKALLKNNPDLVFTKDSKGKTFEGFAKEDVLVLIADSINQELINNAGKGDVQKFKNLIEIGANIIEAIDESGRTALMVAAENGRTEIINTIFSYFEKNNQTTIDKKSHSDSMPRRESIEVGYGQDDSHDEYGDSKEHSFFGLLLSPDTKSTDLSGDPDTETFDEDLAIIPKLDFKKLEKYINQKDRNGQTAADLAIINGNLGALIEMLKNGLNISDIAIHETKTGEEKSKEGTKKNLEWAEKIINTIQQINKIFSNAGYDDELSYEISIKRINSILKEFQSEKDGYKEAAIFDYIDTRNQMSLISRIINMIGFDGYFDQNPETGKLAAILNETLKMIDPKSLFIKSDGIDALQMIIDNLPEKSDVATYENLTEIILKIAGIMSDYDEFDLGNYNFNDKTQEIESQIKELIAKKEYESGRDTSLSELPSSSYTSSSYASSSSYTSSTSCVSSSLEYSSTSARSGSLAYSSSAPGTSPQEPERKNLQRQNPDHKTR